MKPFLKRLFILFVVISTKPLISCNAADQCRLFLLGSSSSGYVFVETQLYRTHDRNNKREVMAIAWFGKSFLKIYDAKHRLLSSLLLDSLKVGDPVSDQQFINNSFVKGLRVAKRLRGYIAAKPVYLSYCDFQPTCEEAQLKEDSAKHKLFVRLGNKKEYDVTLLRDTTSIAGQFLLYYSGFNSGNIDNTGIDISSVRKYTIGAKTLTIVHLASGDNPEEEFEEGDAQIPKRKEYKPTVAFDRLENSVVHEPLLHHGHGFDFFIVE